MYTVEGIPANCTVWLVVWGMFERIHSVLQTLIYSVNCVHRKLFGFYAGPTVNCTYLLWNADIVYSRQCQLYACKSVVGATQWATRQTSIPGQVHMTCVLNRHYTVYTVQCTLYSSHSTMYTIQFTLYSLHCTMYTLQFTLYNAHYTVHTVKIYLWNVYSEISNSWWKSTILYFALPVSCFL